MVTTRRSYIFSHVVGRQRLQSSSTSHCRVAEPLRQDRSLGGNLTYFGRQISLSQRWREGMLRPQQLPPFLRTSLLAARAYRGELCSNFNYIPQIEGHQQHLDLYMEHPHRSVGLAIMIEVTSCHMECTHFNLDYSQVPAVALHHR